MKQHHRQSDNALASAAALLALQKAKQTQAGAASPQAAWTRGMLTTSGLHGAPGAASQHGLTDTADNIIDRLLERLASTGRTSNLVSAHGVAQAGQAPPTSYGQHSPTARHAFASPQACTRSYGRSSSRNSNDSRRHAEQLYRATELGDMERLQLQASNMASLSPLSRAAAAPVSSTAKPVTGLRAQQIHPGRSPSSLNPIHASSSSSSSAAAAPVRVLSSTVAHSRMAYSRSSSAGSDRPSSGLDSNGRNSPVLRHISSCNSRGWVTENASRSSSRSSNSSSDGPAAGSTAQALLALQQLVNPPLITSLSHGTHDSWHISTKPLLQGTAAAVPSNSTSMLQQLGPVAPTGPEVGVPGSAEAACVSRSSSCTRSRPSSTAARSATSSARLAAPARPVAATARSVFSSEPVTDPAVWLPQQHPAVVAALSKDLATATSAGQQLQQQDDSIESVTHPAAQHTAGSVSNCKNSSKKAKQQQALRLLPPQFPGTAPTLLFAAGNKQGFSLLIEQPLGSSSNNLGLECGSQAAAGAAQQNLQPHQQQLQEDPAASDFPDDVLQLHNVKVFVKYYGVANNAVKQVFKASGFKRTKGDAWNVLWGSLSPTEMLTGLHPLQKHNHFPGTWELGRKDRLYKTIAAAARRAKGKAFTFVPKFFVLPSDADDFKLDLAQNPTTTYIRKPAASSRGRGIRVVKDPKALDLSALHDVILQHYIPDPLLIGGRKFDLRVYVAVTCLDPLRVYVYREGLVRFASEQYSSSKSSRGQATMHLTNYSINKTAKGFQQPGAGQSPKKPKPQQQGQAVGQQDDPVSDAAECDGDADEPSDDTAASKWSFGQLAQYLQSQGHDFKLIWDQVCRICTETMIAAEPGLSSITRSTGGPTLMRNCFEVFGFDVLLDSKLKAWLLEVNTSPALNADSPLDVAVKTNMVADVMGLVGVTPCSRETYQQQQAAERQARLTGLNAPAAAAAADSPRASASRSPLLKQQQRMQQATSAAAAGAGSPRVASGSSPLMQQPKQKAQAAATAAAASVRTAKEVDQLDLLAVPPNELPECIRDTEAEWRRCCRQQQRWQRLMPLSNPSRMQELLGLFETPRVSNALVLRYFQQLSKR